MRRVGEVVRVAQNVAVVRAPGEDYVDIGTEVVDENLDDLGRVVDVFGPVERPFLTVTPAGSVNLPSMLNSPLYVR